MRTVIETIGARVPKVPRIPVERSCVMEPRTGPVAANLKDRKRDGRTGRTSACAIGIETGPIDSKGWPKARTELPSTQVTVPVAERSMSPERSCVATAEPGFRAAGSPATLEAGVPDDAEAPEGTVIQLAASAIRAKSVPGERAPPKETGRGRAAREPLGLAWKGLTRSAKRSVKCPVEKAEITEAVEALDPAIGTGGPAGTCRMSIMLWIGVMPQIGSLEKGQPYARAPTSFPST